MHHVNKHVEFSGFFFFLFLIYLIHWMAGRVHMKSITHHSGRGVHKRWHDISVGNGIERKKSLLLYVPSQRKAGDRPTTYRFVSCAANLPALGALSASKWTPNQFIFSPQSACVHWIWSTRSCSHNRKRMNLICLLRRSKEKPVVFLERAPFIVFVSVFYTANTTLK